MTTTATTPPNRAQILASISNLRKKLKEELASLSTTSATFGTAQALQMGLDNSLDHASTAVSLTSTDADALAVWSDWFTDITDPTATASLRAFALLISTDDDPVGQCTYPTSSGTVTRCMTQSECEALTGSSFSEGGC